MARGRIKWYSSGLGHGFISPEDGGVDIFVRQADIRGDGLKSLDNGTRVTYEVVQGREGLEAKNVSKA